MRKFNKLLALLLTLTLCLSMAVTANAADATPHGDVYITKALQVSPGTTADVMEFTFDFERTTDSIGLQTDEVSTYPLPESVKITTPAVSTATDTTQTVKAEGKVVLPTYTHAGIYKYQVKEFVGSATGVGYDSTTVYTMTVGVVNSGDSLVVREIIVDKDGKLQNTASTSSSNDDITTVAGNDFVFNNTYFKTISGKSLEIKNQVAGDYADKTKPFSYKLTVTKNPLDTATSYNTSIEGKTLTFNEGVAVLEFTLKHGESLTISNMVAGASYTVEQTLETGYTTTINSDDTDTDGKIEGVLGETGVTVAYLNTYGQVAPTGISLNNSPFLLMIGVSAMFLLLLFVTKKRREEA